jgi:outer membrane protein assembly factor BamB
LFLLLSTAPFAVADWPQWLGPNRDNSASESLPVFKTAPKRVWHVAVGEGNSSPVVTHGLVFLHTKVKDKDIEKVQAFDAKSGELKWEKTYEKVPFKPPYGEGPRATPTVDGKLLFTFGNTGVLVCWEAETGKEVWKVDTLKEFQAPNITFGITSSPLVLGDQVIVMVGNNAKKPQGAGLVSFDKSTGKLKWKSLNDIASYASPVLLNKQLVALTGEHLLAVEPSDGKLLWKQPFKDTLLESSTTPIRVGDIYLASSITAGTIALKLEEKDGKTEVKEVWKDPALTGYFSTPVAIDDKHVYLVAGKLLPPQFATLHCIELSSGKKLWSRERIGKYHASLMKLKDGKLLMLDDSGNLILLEASSKEYKELARTSLFKANGDAWAHPALVDGNLFIRDGKELSCYRFTE